MDVNILISLLLYEIKNENVYTCQGGMGHWTENYIGTQGFINMFFHSLAYKHWIIFLNLDILLPTSSD